MAGAYSAAETFRRAQSGAACARKLGSEVYEARGPGAVTWASTIATLVVAVLRISSAIAVFDLQRAGILGTRH